MYMVAFKILKLFNTKGQDVIDSVVYKYKKIIPFAVCAAGQTSKWRAYEPSEHLKGKGRCAKSV